VNDEQDKDFARRSHGRPEHDSVQHHVHGLDDRTYKLFNALLTIFNESAQTLKRIETEVKHIMATVVELQASVATLTKEVGENNTLLDSLQQTNNTNATTIAGLIEQVNALTISVAEKDALLAGLDEIKTGIDSAAAALDARQQPETPVSRGRR
jgi:chromosome segregation ATPase